MSRKHSPWWLYSQGSRTASSNTGIEELKEILKKLELSEYCDAFEKEKMDREALVRSSVIFFFSISCISSLLFFPVLPPVFLVLSHLHMKLLFGAQQEQNDRDQNRTAHTSLLRG